ncbi:voltage-dependent anion channel, partial [Kipferlia bialata]|eukprot:g4560.t1
MSEVTENPIDNPVEEKEVVKDSFLKHVGIAFFTALMGLISPALVLRRFQRDYDLPAAWANTYLAVTSVVFFVFLGLFAVRCIKYFDSVKKEFNHPIKRNFFP